MLEYIKVGRWSHTPVPLFKKIAGSYMPVVVCAAHKLRPRLSYSRRRDRINCVLLRSLDKGGGGYTTACLPDAKCSTTKKYSVFGYVVLVAWYFGNRVSVPKELFLLITTLCLRVQSIAAQAGGPFDVSQI